MYFLQRALQPEIAELRKRMVLKAGIVLVVLMPVGLIAARHFGWLAPGTIPRLGLGCELPGGLILVTFEYSLPWVTTQPV
jgi:hypothetical protein